MTKHRHYDAHDVGPEWATPPRIWKPLADALDGFTLDPASGCEPEPIADYQYTPRENGLTRPWFGDVWVNPPYGREFNDPWAEKIAGEAEREAVESVTALVAAATSTNRWHTHFSDADYYTFIEGRVSFIGAKKGAASFASVLLTWGDVPSEYVNALETLGLVLEGS